MHIDHFPEFMIKLGKPLGWTQDYSDNPSLQKEYLKKMELTTYFDYTKYSFVNVLENLFMF